MFYRVLSVVLVAVLLHSSLAAQDQPLSSAQTVANMQQVLHKAQEKDMAVKVILKKKIDNQKKFSGKVSEISDAGFVVTDLKTGKSHQVVYEQVKEVSRKGMSRGEKIATGIAIAGAFVLVMFLLSALGIIRGND